MTDTFTVMVKWTDSARAERMGRGYTVTRKIHAIIFRSRENAERNAPGSACVLLHVAGEFHPRLTTGCASCVFA